MEEGRGTDGGSGDWSSSGSIISKVILTEVTAAACQSGGGFRQSLWLSAQCDITAAISSLITVFAGVTSMDVIREKQHRMCCLLN